MNWTEADSETLFKACAASTDRQAWDEFMRRYLDLIARTALRVASRWTKASPELVADLIQQTHVKLLGGALKQFRAVRADSDYGYIKVVTANVVTDHFRPKADETVPLESVCEPVDVLPNPERAYLLVQIRNLIQEIAGGPTGERDKRIFFLYYSQGLTAREISLIPEIGLQVKGVETVIVRLVQGLKKRLLPNTKKEDDNEEAPSQGRPRERAPLEDPL